MIRETVASNCSLAHVRLEPDVLGVGRRTHRRHRLAEPLAHLADRLHGARVCVLDPAVLDEGVGDQRHLVALVIEGDEQVADHQRHVGQADRVGVRLVQGLDRADEVVAEEAHGAPGERRQLIRLRDLEAAQVVGDGRVRIRGVRDSVGWRSGARLRSRLAAPLREPSVAPAQDRPRAGTPGRTSGRAGPAPRTRAGTPGRRRAA